MARAIAVPAVARKNRSQRSDCLHSPVWYTASQKMCQTVLSELRQISTNFDSFWRADGKEDKMRKVHLFFTLPDIYIFISNFYL